MELILNILITGDTICDRHIFRGEKMNASSINEGTKIISKTGSEDLTYQLTDGIRTPYTLLLILGFSLPRIL
jgi:hypothetical protein